MDIVADRAPHTRGRARRDGWAITRFRWLCTLLLGCSLVGACAPIEDRPEHQLRGSTRISIWLPPEPGFYQETVAIGNGSADGKDSYVAVRLPIISKFPGNVASYRTQRVLTVADWEDLQRVRKAWCAHPPAPLPPAADAPVYRMALACTDGINSGSREDTITADQLPAAIRAIIDSLPASAVPLPTPTPAR